jgi:hypothetical protein
MNSLQILQRGIYKEYASSWEEIAPKDAPYIGRYLYLLESGQICIDVFRKLVVDRMIGRVNTLDMPLEGIKAWDMWANEGRLAETVDFFFKKEKTADGTETYEVIPSFTKNLLPFVRSKWGIKQHGPGDFLGEMTFVEYKDLLFCSGKYMQTKDVAWLDRMMAISYRPKRLFLWLIRQFPSFDGRTRVKYRPGATDFRIGKFAKLEIGAKYIFFQYLMGCIYTLKNDGDGQGIEIDGNACFFSLVFNKKRKSEDDAGDDDQGVGMTGVLMALAESGVFGKIDETANSDVWDVLVRLYQLELQSREMDRKMKK